MPTYVYHCDACDTDFEVQQRMSDAPITACECGEGGQVRRMLSPGAGVIFKGSGFYETDYKRSNGNGTGSSESKGEPKGDSKPATGGCGSSACCANNN